MENTKTERTKNEGIEKDIIKINKVIIEFSKDIDIINFINNTENSIKTTQNNYGIYYQFLSNYAKDKIVLYIISKALILAGANLQGVKSALSVIRGN